MNEKRSRPALLPEILAASVCCVLVVGSSERARAADGYVVAIDKTGSMRVQTHQCGTPMRRCDCATIRARAQVDQIFAAVASAEVAVVSFSGATFTLVQNFTNNKALVKAGLAGACDAATPLADALCFSSGELFTNYGGGSDTRTLWMFTDGGENSSTGACAGPFSSSPTPPYTAGSWHNLVYNKFTGDQVVANINDMYQKNGDAALSSAVEGVPAPDSSAAGPTDRQFFAALASATGGQYLPLPDEEGPIVIPTLSQAGLVVFSILLFGSMFYVIRRRRRPSF